jgi:hypothetical protein
MADGGRSSSTGRAVLRELRHRGRDAEQGRELLLSPSGRPSGLPTPFSHTETIPATKGKTRLTLPHSGPLAIARPWPHASSPLRVWMIFLRGAGRQGRCASSSGARLSLSQTKRLSMSLELASPAAPSARWCRAGQRKARRHAVDRRPFILSGPDRAFGVTRRQRAGGARFAGTSWWRKMDSNQRYGLPYCLARLSQLGLSIGDFGRVRGQKCESEQGGLMRNRL